MKKNLIISICMLIISCTDSNEIKNEGSQVSISKNKIETCDYIKYYEKLGNRIIDTIRIGKNVVDPIDDRINFLKADFGFVTKGNQIFKKSKTYEKCGETYIEVEYYQDLTDRIELETYQEFDGRFFTSKNRVNFWWANSGGHMIIPIENADPKTFKPFEELCGGVDKNGIYYGCPNRGVYRLNIPVKSKYNFIPKENNYWNSPKHYVVIDNEVYNVKYKLERGYYCELDKNVSVEDIEK